MYPATFDSAIVETTFGTRTSARYQRIDDLPIGPFKLSVNALGVQETAELGIAFGEKWGIGVAVVGESLVGVSAESLATQGALYSYGASIAGAFRLFRIDSSGTQLTVRAEGFGLQGGGRLSLLPLLVAIRNQPQAVLNEIASSGRFLVTPASWWGFAGSVNLAQAFSSTFSLQASFRLDVKRFTESPFIPSQGGRVDISSTGWLPQVGVGFGANPPGFPVSFLLEYRAAAQDVHDPTSLAHHTLALGGYYSARYDLQVGPVISGEFGLPEVFGFDADGNLAASQRGKAIAGQLKMQYIW
jgi:hypothetical protein